ncbi:unnamed protein product [Polarella glacialis]|uniref:EF-hand domain-containing protein n=1 Tax=Polarella glacialis TaxID=89957 RepID=A0A813H934_POLGL|nr:unnamed protein product [Polarella glacialis]
MQQIARSDWFSYITLLVISMNAVYIGVSEDWNKSDTLLESHLVFQLFDHFFCGCFTLELIVRFCAFRHKSDALRDNWFKFDALLVLLSIFDTWLMTAILAITNTQTVALPTVGSALKLLRLLRLSRLVRLVRCLPELLTLINGMREGARAVGSSLLLVAILIYMFGIVMHMFLSSNEALADMFGTLSLCMWTLLLDGALTSETKPTLEALLSEEEHAMVFIFLFFVFLSCLTVMNMLIGVLCEVVSAVKQLEEQTAAHELVKGTVLVLLKQLDVDESGDISKEEMANVMEHEQARACLQDLNVDVEHLMDLLDMHYEDESVLSMLFLLELILACRGDQPSATKHVIAESMFLRWDLKETMHELEKRLDKKFQAIMPHAFAKDSLSSFQNNSNNDSIATAAPPSKSRASSRASSRKG